MLRSEILDAARDCVTRDRANTYGPAENSFGLIAAYWSAHLGHPVSATDVSAMMALLKLARIKVNPSHADSWVDAAGYLACGGEIATSGDATDAAIAAVMEPERWCSTCRHRVKALVEQPCRTCLNHSAWEMSK